MTTTAAQLAEELNSVAEYAGLPESVEFRAVETSSGHANVFLNRDDRGEPFQVDIAWAMGNVKRLPDGCTLRQVLQALAVSHPNVKGVGPKYRERT